MKSILLACLLAMVFGGIIAAPGDALAQRPIHLGIQGGYGSDDLDWFLGGRAELGTSRIFKRSRAVFDFNWHFPSGSFKYYEFDLNYLWPLATLENDSGSNLYVGAGLNVGRGWFDGVDANWEVGMNVLGGLNWDLRGRAAFFEGGYKFITDYDHWFGGVGFLF